MPFTLRYGMSNRGQRSHDVRPQGPQIRSGREEELSRQLFAPHRLATWLVNDSETLPHAWLYSDEPPPTNWAQPDFDDSAWLSADAPFGNDANTLFPPGSLMKGDRIWLRKNSRSLTARAVPALRLPMAARPRSTSTARSSPSTTGTALVTTETSTSAGGSMRCAWRKRLAVETQRTHEREKRVDIGLYVY